VNIDHRKTVATDLVCDIRRLPYLDNSAELIESYHVIEHMPHVVIDNVLSEWARVLKPGGQIVLECPDFDRTVREYLEGNEERIINVYGWQRFEGDYHLYGYNPKRLAERLQRAGFTDITFPEPQDYHTQLEPCLRAEAIKP
jgi:ubiquinone/menaquinone biosynthesis C-methylase UbiE